MLTRHHFLIAAGCVYASVSACTSPDSGAGLDAAAGGSHQLESGAGASSSGGADATSGATGGAAADGATSLGGTPGTGGVPGVTGGTFGTGSGPGVSDAQVGDAASLGDAYVQSLCEAGCNNVKTYCTAYDVATCISSCQTEVGYFPGCEKEYWDLAACTSALPASSFTCIGDKAAPPDNACVTERQALLLCP